MPDNIYESDRLVREYLLFHYGEPEEQLPWKFGPRDALGFARRCVRELIDPLVLPQDARALDIGCAVGGASFELARYCRDVTGIDYSAAFIDAAEIIRNNGALDYLYSVEGERTERAVARAPEDVDCSRIKFTVGDAMAVPADVGEFDVVLAGNLLCRLPDPRVFIARLPSLVKKGGQLLLTTPFTWLEEFTPRGNWIGGRDGVSSADELASLLRPSFKLDLSVELPFLIREHARKFQWSVARGARWLRL